MHCFSKSLIVIRRYHHFTHRAAIHCYQSLRAQDEVRDVASFVDILLLQGGCVSEPYGGHTPPAPSHGTGLHV